jgi:hypothetical protein
MSRLIGIRYMDRSLDLLRPHAYAESRPLQGRPIAARAGFCCSSARVDLARKRPIRSCGVFIARELPEVRTMTEKSRTVLIALGVSLLVVVLAPLLVCVGGMMGGAGGMGDMGSMMGDGGSMMGGGRMMVTGGVVLLLILVAGIVSLVLGLRRG